MRRLSNLCPLLLVLLLVACSSGVEDVRLDRLNSTSESELKPNVEAFPADNLYLETTSDGRTLLRFDATTWNSGAGPLELVAGEVVTDTSRQKVYQRISLDGGGDTEYLAGEFVWHEEHDHFHFEDYANYTLQPVDAPVASERVGSKTTFCIIDTDRINHRLPGAPKRAVYTSCSDTVQGMSVGWGDTNKAGLAGQEIDVTDLPDGEYRLVIDADPMGKIIESNDNDNSSEVRILLSVQSGTLEVVEESDTGNDRPGNCPHC